VAVEIDFKYYLIIINIVDKCIISIFYYIIKKWANNWKVGL
jgi:hypothetical protein